MSVVQAARSVVFCYGSLSRLRWEHAPKSFPFFSPHGTKMWLSGGEARLRGKASCSFAPSGVLQLPLCQGVRLRGAAPGTPTAQEGV